jgi:hypothetical protein
MRVNSVRGRRLLGFGVLVALASIPIPQQSAVAACAPGLRIDRKLDIGMVAQGETITVVGSGYVQGCNDGGDPTPACGAPLYERPKEDIELRLSQDSDEVLLGVADATKVDDDFGRVTWTVTIPATADVGRAVLKADGAALRVKIRSGETGAE